LQCQTYHTLLHWKTLLVITASDAKDLCNPISFPSFTRIYRR
jgi:hypothetical protein